jgi:hypothetical protein
VSGNGVDASHFAQHRRNPRRVDDAVGIGRGHDPVRSPRRLEALRGEFEGVSPRRTDVGCRARKATVDDVDREARRLFRESARSIGRAVDAIVAIDDHIERREVEASAVRVALFGEGLQCAQYERLFVLCRNHDGHAARSRHRRQERCRIVHRIVRMSIR